MVQAATAAAAAATVTGVQETQAGGVGSGTDEEATRRPKCRRGASS